jgi:hypothetical protein
MTGGSADVEHILRKRRHHRGGSGNAFDESAAAESILFHIQHPLEARTGFKTTVAQPFRAA